MKKVLRVLLIVAVAAPLSAYTSTNIAGQTGLISTPTARINWEGTNSNAAMTAGYNYFYNGSGYNVPHLNIALFDRVEVGGAFNAAEGTNNNDLLIHSKCRFSPWSGRGNSALAVGGSYQNLNSSPSYSVGQAYLAATYEAVFFGMEADTSVVVGKTLGSITRTGDIDFSMGFDLNFFPGVFNGYVRWLNEIANYDFLYGNAPTRAGTRGTFHTGFRVPVLKSLNNVKFDVTMKMTDALDDERGFGIGFVFGGRL